MGIEATMNVVITGTSSGIGQAMAQHLLEEGHQVWGLARRPQLASNRFHSSMCDVAEWGSIKQAAAEVGRHWNQVDALICCAGAMGSIGPAIRGDPNEWAGTVRVNLVGTFFTIRAFFETLRRTSRRGKILCFSGGGATTPRPNFSAYGAAKAGIVRLVETLAAEWQDLAMDINAIAPGAITTAMTEQIARAGIAAGEKELTAARNQLDQGGQSLDKVLMLADFLLSQDSDGLRGKLISAQWDEWQTFASRREDLMSSDRYTLRRITEARER